MAEPGDGLVSNVSFKLYKKLAILVTASVIYFLAFEEGKQEKMKRN